MPKDEVMIDFLLWMIFLILLGIGFIGFTYKSPFAMIPFVSAFVFWFSVWKLTSKKKKKTT